MSEFDAARRSAVVRDLLRAVLGKPTYLLPFAEVRERLRLRHLVDRGLQEVPLDLIVGSLGRAGEFDRAFLPRSEALRDRWRQVRELAEGTQGFPPVELYKVGQIYFVVDGHHRISVARSLGAPAIEAWVKEFSTPVPLGPEVSLEELLLEEGMAAFLEVTGLAAGEGDAYRVTVAHGYDRLLDHISVHRYFLGVERGGPVSWQEAVASWRDGIHRPMVETIRRCGVLREFPGRTETDLYLFVMDHLHHLRQQYASASLPPDRAVRHFTLARREQRTIWDILRSWWRRLLGGPPPD